MKIYEIRDPVYGFIKFNDWEKDIINHPAFQRLRRIRQLGLTDLIYPGAMHTRFEHSLGVMHLATKMYDAIVEKEENKKILKEYLHYDDAGLKRDRQIVRLAALLHDIGHPPFSHASEELFPVNPQTKKRFKHEDYTVAIIKGPLKDVIENHDLNSNYKIKADEVASLIEGTGKDRILFWRILISSQLDADRADYLLRDSLHIGVKYGIYDIDRLLITLSLGINPEKTETGEIILGVTKGGWRVAESLIIARYLMFTQVYYHKARRAYDFMLKEAIKETIEEFPPPDKIEEFLEYDDFKLWSLMESFKSEWFLKIKKRDHIRVIEETKEIPTEEEINKIEKIKEILENNNIWYFEDCQKKAKSWYEMGSDEEIKIITKNGKSTSFSLEYSIRDLSEYSVIVKGLKQQYSKIRVYVKSEDRDKAAQLLRRFLK